MGEIVLQFSTTSDLESFAIKVFQHGYWCTHVDTVLPDGTLLGAHFKGGVAIRPPHYDNWSQTKIVKLETTDDIVEDYLAFVRAQVGKPYDTTAIEAFAFGRNWREDDSWFCDELVLAGLERKFLVHPLPLLINRYTPSDLMLVCSQYTDVT